MALSATMMSTFLPDSSSAPIRCVWLDLENPAIARSNGLDMNHSLKNPLQGGLSITSAHRISISAA